MNMPHTMKMLFSAAVLCAALSAPAYALGNVQQQARALSAELERAAAQAQQAQALNLAVINTTWERCNILESRPRCNGKPRVRVVKPWSCKDVYTRCSAVESGDKIYVPAACFYAPTRGKQQITLKESRLTTAAGRSFSLLEKFIGKVQDFVVFDK